MERLPETATANSEFVRNLNLGIALELVKDKGPISRAGIARITGMSRSTCSLIVDELLRSGLVVETGKDASTGGRKPILVRLHHEAGIAIGVKIEERRIIAALVDLRGEALSTLQEDVPEPADAEGYLRVLRRMVRRLVEEEKGSSGRKILGIGIGLSGLVDSEQGISLESVILNWRDLNLREELRKDFPVPVYVENDVNTFAIGEKWLGIGKGFKNFLCVTIGRGVGVGIILNGALYRGAHHGAGEFGHTKISDDRDAPVCSCGRRGCIEAFVSTPAILGFVREAVQRGEHSSLSRGELTPQAVHDAAARGDGLALAAYRRAGRVLGLGLANLINLFDPEAIIVSGEGTVAGEFVFPEMEKALIESSVYGLADRVKRIPLFFEDNMWVRGVATLVVREVFRIPL
jgi:glucokinase-like ROK family protein